MNQGFHVHYESPEFQVMNVKYPTEQVKSVIEPRTLVSPHLEIKLDIQVNYKRFLVVLQLKGRMRLYDDVM